MVPGGSVRGPLRPLRTNSGSGARRRPHSSSGAGKTNVFDHRRHVANTLEDAPPVLSNLWAAARILEDTSLMTVSLAFGVSGALDVAALSASVRAVAQRHQLLHSRLAEDGGVLRLRPAEPAELDVVESAECDASLDLALDRPARPFRLREEPLFRAVLVRQSADRCLLGLGWHGMAADGRSRGLTCRELGELYGRAVAGRPVTLAEPPLALTDFVRATAEADAAAYDADLRYWSEQLSDLPATALPADLAGSDDDLVRYDAAVRGFPDDVDGRSVREHTRKLKITSFVLFAAAFTAALAEVTGRDDVRVASLVPNPRVRGATRVVGPLSQVALLRLRDARAPFGDHLGRVRGTVLDALSHQSVPFDDVIGMLERRGVASGAAAPVTLTVSRESPLLELPGAVVRRVRRVRPVDSHYPPGYLTLSVVERANDYRLRLRYDATRLSRERVDELLARTENAVRSGVAP